MNEDLETREAKEAQIARLQKNLSALRRIAGWTMEEMGKRIGVTKQTISNLENHRGSSMTLTQYLAIRSVLDSEAVRRISKDQNDKLLLQAIYKVLDENLDENEQEDVEENVALLASAVVGKTSQQKIQELADEKIPIVSEKNVRPEMISAIATMVGAGIVVGATSIPTALGGIPVVPLLASVIFHTIVKGNNLSKTGTHKKKER